MAFFTRTYKTVCLSVVVCSVGVPYSASWNFSQYFYAIRTPALRWRLTCMQNVTVSPNWEPKTLIKTSQSLEGPKWYHWILRCYFVLFINCTCPTSLYLATSYACNRRRRVSLGVDDLRGGQLMARVLSRVKTLLKILTGWLGCSNVTDRQTYLWRRIPEVPNVM